MNLRRDPWLRSVTLRFTSVSMQHITTLGEHLIIVRVPVFTDIILCFWVPEITVYTLRKAACTAARYAHFHLIRRCKQCRFVSH